MSFTRASVVDTRSIVLDTDLSVVSCRIVSVPKTPSGEGTGDVTQHIL